MNNEMSPEKILQWLVTAGVDETVGDSPVDRLNAPVKNEEITLQQNISPASFPKPTPLVEIQTESLVSTATSLDELKEIVSQFKDCPLKETATNTVFGAGNPQARLMIIGEAPGAEEDKQGLPFVGASGHLLDLMLASIGLKRSDVYITNILPWRPPGNRKPSEAETALLTPFVRKHIELVNPQVLLLLGGSSLSALMNTHIGITKARGHWLVYTDKNKEIDVMPSFHPAFLLRTPAQKKLAWRDLLSVKSRLGL